MKGFFFHRSTTALFFRSRSILVVLAMTLALLSGCYDPIKEFDNPYDPENGGELPTADSGGQTEGSSFPVAVGTAIEFQVPSDLHGGLTYRHFEPIFYRASGAGELDFTGSLEADLSSLPVLNATVDGEASEWGSQTLMFTDSSGDAPGIGAGEALTNFHMAQGDAGDLYVAFELADASPNPDTLYILHMADSAGFGWGSAGFVVFHDGTDWLGVVSEEGVPIPGAHIFNAAGVVEGVAIEIQESGATLSGMPGDHLAIFGFSQDPASLGEEIELVFNLPPISAYTEYTDGELATPLDLKIGTYLRGDWFSQATAGSLSVGEYDPNPDTFYIEAAFSIITAAGDSLTGTLMVDGWQ